MLAIVALFFLTAVSALPTLGPVVAILPPGSNVTVGWEGKPPSILTSGFKEGLLGMENLYHKVEFHFLDFQMNQTAPFASNLVQNLEIYINNSFGIHKGFSNGENLNEETTFTSDIPDSPQGFTQLFSGLYNGGSENKISIDRTVTYDMCGIIQDKGWMNVWVKPLNGATVGSFREGFYTCFYNLNIGTNVVHEGESRRSGIFQCNSGSLNNYSFRLWYQIRFYNIDGKICQIGSIHTN